MVRDSQLLNKIYLILMINVLSLFDGYSGGQIALNRAGIGYGLYFASEIDKHCIAVTQANYPDTIQLGDVCSVDVDALPKIDLLIGGSPCQGFSFAGKQLNFQDLRSKLFFEYVRILNALKAKNPNLKFLLENVRMKKEYQAVISQAVGVEPIALNSALVSAQSRNRLYWTNIPNISPPADKGILLRDILHENVDEILDIPVPNFNINPSGRGMGGNVYPISKEKANTVTTQKGEGPKMSVAIAKYIVPYDKTLQILDKEVARGKIGYFRQDSQANRVYYLNDKAITLCGEAGGGAAKMGMYLFGHIQRERGNNQGGMVLDKPKSPTLTSNCFQENNHLVLGCITPDRTEICQNGGRFNDGKKFYTLTAQDRHGVLIEGYIRKLTPTECERLQTVPDGYTAHVSNAQRYKMLGNGFTVDIIAHILKHTQP